MSKLLLIAFSPAEAEAASGFAQSFGMPFDLLCLTGSAPAVGAEKATEANLEAIPPADGLGTALAAQSTEYSHVAAMSSMKAKDVLPRMAALLDAAMVSDVIATPAKNQYQRPYAAGAAIATVEVTSDKTVMTIRPAGFPQGEPNPNGSTEATSLDITSKAEVTQAAQASGGRPDLTQAKVVVSGGRPLKDAATFEELIGGLADHLGGAAGATRAAVDSGIASNELQVGQTGKIVAPDLYIAAGISGSTQHMAGIKDSKVIVAINTDGDAPIFESADFGLVMDLFDAIPELKSKL
jgi:electron transfer flavoprotein alpha subunit